MNIAYIRISDPHQNPARQIEKMKTLDIEERFVFIDKQSGKTFDRPQYQAMKNILREGDLIYIDALDRLGRDYDGIITEWKTITRIMGVDIVVLEQENVFDSRKFRAMGDTGKLMEDQFLSLLSYVADQEREKIRKRQREGIDIALSQGKPYGRKSTTITPAFIKAYTDWKSGTITATVAMQECNYKRTTFYKKAKEYECQILKSSEFFPQTQASPPTYDHSSQIKIASDQRILSLYKRNRTMPRNKYQYIADCLNSNFEYDVQKLKWTAETLKHTIQRLKINKEIN